jgi:hypothetical protein
MPIDECARFDCTEMAATLDAKWKDKKSVRQMAVLFVDDPENRVGGSGELVLASIMC